MVTRSAWSTALALNLALPAATAAREPKFLIYLPAGRLADALVYLSTQTGVSLGASGSLSGLRNAAVRGRMDVREALRRLLVRTPLVAERAGPSAWRLVSRRSAVAAPALAPAPAVSPDILVTGRKLVETLSQVPAPVQVWTARQADPSAGAATDAHDVERGVEGLSLTNLGPGRDRPFIRGIADSPFNGFGQTTVSVVVDNARVTYDAPDPGLRMVDVARVEVLKGPQGPLYGTGALGGVLRVVTNHPVLGVSEASISEGVDAVAGGGPGTDFGAMLNVPLLRDRLAVRVVGYVAMQGGWVDDTGGRSNINDTLVRGGRAAARLSAAGWTVDVAGALQFIRQRDSQYVDGAAEDLTRTLRVAEPSSTAFRLVHATAQRTLGSARLTVASSHAWQDRDEVYATGTLPAAAPRDDARSYRDRRSNRVFDQEVRLAPASVGRSSWLAGVSFLSAQTMATGDLQAAGAQPLRIFDLHRSVTEAAVFGQVEAPLAGKVSFSAGGRLFRATTDDERREELAQPTTRARAKLGFSPSASLTYAFTPRRLAYLRFGGAFRPGGLDPENARTGRYDADEVSSIDIGTRLLLADGRLSLSADAFRSSWVSVQSDYLRPDGLVATRNAGDALVVGGDASGEWRPGAWRLSIGLTAQRARLVAGVDGADLPVDPRLPVVPDATARLTIGRSVAIGGRHAMLQLGGNYFGRARLSFDDGLDRAMGNYATLRAGASGMLGGAEVSVQVENLLDTRADTFAFGNPFLVRNEREYTPLRPRSVRINLFRRFR